MAKDALQQLARLHQAAPAAAREALRYTAHWMEAQARQTTSFHDRTGNLRASITGQLGEEGTTVYAALGAGLPGVGATMEYAPYLELGTQHMAPRPYIRPAVELAVAQQILPRALQGFLERALA